MPKKDAQNPLYNNVTEQPLLLETFEELKTCLLWILDFLPPSQLQLNLQIVNHIYKFMLEFDGGIWKSEVEAWAQKALCKKELWHGGEFQGNQCVRLLENLSFFEDGSGNARIPLMTPILVVLKAYNEVRKKCFTATGVAADYQEAIKKFRESYMVANEDLRLSVTPTAHDVFFHLQQFIEKYPNVYLGLVSEQTTESIHRLWLNFIENRMIDNQDHPDYPTKFKQTLVSFNSKRI